VCREDAGGNGCILVNITCSSITQCDLPVGCDVDSSGAAYCIVQNITSTFDLCGVCLGDYSQCFFSSVFPVSSIGGIAGGAVAGIVVACIIAAALFFWLTKKGYDYYKAKGDLSSQGLHDNPAFQDHGNHGQMVEH